MMPSISIIIPVYNGEETILQTLKTSLAQDYDNFDVIVVNDGSTDKTLSLLHTVTDNRLKVIDCKKNMGRSNARNFGVSSSHSDYIAFLDADDLIPPHKLKTQMQYMLRHRLDLCGTWGMAIDQLGHEQIYKHPIEDATIKKRIIKSHVFIHSSVICKHDLFMKSGGYDSSLSFSEDYDLFLRIVPHAQCGNVPETLVSYRLPSGIKYALKEQCSIARIRLRAITKYHYPKISLPFVFTPLISFFIPRKFKLFIKKIIN